MKRCSPYAPMIGSRPGELTADEARELQLHLQSCAACRSLAADLAATEGLVADALLARASARDFAPFVDAVMARIPGGAAAAEPQGRLAWLHRHWKAVAATVAPTLAALALFMYVQSDAGRAEVAALELDTVGNVSTVLQTQDGPVVLIDDDEDDAGI